MKSVDLVQMAKDRLTELDAMQATQDAERARLKDFLETAALLQAPHHGVGLAVRELGRSIPNEAPTPVREIRRRAAAIIGALGRPVPLAELHTLLLRERTVVGGTDPRSNLSAKLSGADELESIPGKGWIVRKDKGPAAGTAEPHLNGTAG